MKKVVAAIMFCLWPILVTATGATDNFSSARVGAIEIKADEIEMVSPFEFHAKGNVVISGRGGEIRAHMAIITEDGHIITIEAEELPAD